MQDTSFVEYVKQHLSQNPQDAVEIMRTVVDYLDEWKEAVLKERNMLSYNAMSDLLLLNRVDKKCNSETVPFMINAAFFLFPNGEESARSTALHEFFEKFRNAFIIYNKSESELCYDIRSWLIVTQRNQYIPWLEKYILTKKES